MDPYVDLLAGGEQQRAYVNVRLELFSAQHLEGDVDQLLGRVRKLEAHDVRGTAHAVEVSGAFQEEELLLLSVPVSADALEHSGAVVEGVSHEAELDVVVPAVLAVVVNPGIGVDGLL